MEVQYAFFLHAWSHTNVFIQIIHVFTVKFSCDDLDLNPANT